MSESTSQNLMKMFNGSMILLKAHDGDDFTAYDRIKDFMDQLNLRDDLNSLEIMVIPDGLDVIVIDTQGKATKI